MLASLPNDGEELLTSAIEQFDINEEAAHCLIKSWQNGDKQNLEQFATLAEMSPQMEEVFMHQRNRDWADKLTQGSIFPSNSGNYLVVVGALHLIGPDNLLMLLESRGFKVTQRSKSQAANCQFNF
ncbi:possible ligase [Vibrio ponticus]|nr:possible ligase [Vibrio ponticus]